MSEEKQKYIRTITGKITKEEILKKIKENNSISKKNFPKITTLPFEHIIQNLCNYLNQIPNIEPKENITLSNYSNIISHPFSIFQNLYLDADVALASNELNYLKQFNTNLICDVTNVTNGQNKEKLKEISNLSNIQICFGYSIDIEKIRDLKKYSNDIQYEIVYGFDNLVPSFIGEEIIKEKFPFNEYEEKVYDMVLNDIVNKYDIPIFFKLNGKQKLFETNNFLAWIKNKKIVNKKKIIFSISISDNDENQLENIKKLCKDIVENDYSLILSIYDCDVLKNKSEEKIDLYFNKIKAKFINSFLLENKKYISNIMLSNNINFKIQLKYFGGFGYINLFENYFDIITNNLNQEEINSIFYLNLLNILEYWKELEKYKKKIKMIKCENCGKEMEEEDPDIFRKFDKNFCSFSCLKKYLSVNSTK
jgi:hypothetical protein